MDIVKFNSFQEVVTEDFNRMGVFAVQGVVDLIADFLLSGTGVVGLQVSAQAVVDMSVYVKLGRIYQAGLQGKQETNTGPLAVTAAHTTMERIDRVCAQYANIEDTPETRNMIVDINTHVVSPQVVNTRIRGGVNIQVIPGTPAATPLPPAIPDGWIALAKVHVRAGATSIAASDIEDERGILRTLQNHTHSGGMDGAPIALATRALTADALSGHNGSDFAFLSQFGALLAENGYQRFPSGMILQWMTVWGPYGIPHFCPYPIAFPNACYAASLFSMNYNQVFGDGQNSRSGVNVTSTNTGSWVPFMTIAVGS